MNLEPKHVEIYFIFLLSFNLEPKHMEIILSFAVDL